VSLLRKLSLRKKRRKLRVRKRLSVDSNKLRISVFRSLSHIYAQAIDDAAGVTIASCSTVSLQSLSGNKKEKARLVGKELAMNLLNKGVKQVFFDRGRFLYHGRVRELAEGIRETGLQI